MANQKLNAREYPLPDSFLYDLKVELGGTLDVLVAEPMPAAADCDHPQTFTLTKSLKGVRYRREPGDGTTPAKIITTWAFVKPDGSTHWLDVIVPEAERLKIETSPHLTGTAYVLAIYDATKPEALAAFNQAWGIG